MASLYDEKFFNAVRKSTCAHEWEWVIFEPWQMAQYTVPARRVHYCPECQRSQSDWDDPYDRKSTVRPEQLDPYHVFTAPFSFENYDENAVEEEYVSTLPEGMNPRSTEAVMIHWQQSLEH